MRSSRHRWRPGEAVWAIRLCVICVCLLKVLCYYGAKGSLRALQIQNDSIVSRGGLNIWYPLMAQACLASIIYGEVTRLGWTPYQPQENL